MKSFLIKNIENLVNFFILFSIFLFLTSYFKPEYLFLKTIVAGGDTASHYYPAYFLKHYLLPKLKVVGWCPGWYAGFPLFQFYFPFLFIVSVLMSYLIPLEISFKLVTVLGTFLLPLTTFFSLKLMGFKFPTPIIAAIFTLAFLFNEGNSMWGGNIPSTLAGEFSYSFSLSLTVLFFGLLYSSIDKQKNLIKNLIVFAIITFTHIYTTLFAIASSAFFLINKKIKKIFKNLFYLFKVYALAFLLIGFWLVPFVLNLEYTTPYNFQWIYFDIRKEIFPDILLPFAFLACVGIIIGIKKKDKRILFFLFSISISCVFYFLSPAMGVVDIRFLPFIQLLITLIAGYAIGEIIRKFRTVWLISIVTIVILLINIVWVNKNVTYIHFWIKWNYEGFENKPLWNVFRDINEYLRGSYKDPRVIFEHSNLHDLAGSPRAFESLPLFSGRSTYEGLYMQSSISSPFIFYFQTEISETAPCPYPQWSPCTSYNSTKAAKHLAMFNVEYIIARTDSVKNDLRNNELYTHVATFEPYEIYKLNINPNKYVTVPKYQPVVFERKNWKVVAYEWFKREELLDVPLVFTDDKSEFSLSSNSLLEIPKVPLNNSCNIREEIDIEEIKFSTDCVGKPHIISISYYPNWKVEGARKVYLVSPSFMLVIPNKKDVRLYYGESLIDLLGKISSYLGILTTGFIILSRNQKFKRFIKRYTASWKKLNLLFLTS
ncbi:MAG: 6-pyruvoyl-tetrahydropterin synthase-related protein [Candidatus Aenigmatarchaeota archaeon]